MLLKLVVTRTAQKHKMRDCLQTVYRQRNKTSVRVTW